MIDVVLTTWPNHPKRIASFARTVGLLDEGLRASRHRLRLYASSESERDPASSWHGGELRAVCQACQINLAYRVGLPASVGANINAALRMGDADLILLVQDDFDLLYPLDLSDGANFLNATPSVDLLRYSWKAGRQSLYDHPDGWRRVHLAGPWPYGDNPFLCRRDFLAKWGPYREGGEHGISEIEMCQRMIDGDAEIAAADRIYFEQAAGVSSVPASKETRTQEFPR